MSYQFSKQKIKTEKKDWPIVRVYRSRIAKLIVSQGFNKATTSDFAPHTTYYAEWYMLVRVWVDSTRYQTQDFD